MAARARKTNESFKKYRKNLKEEQRQIEAHLKGKFLHVSRSYVPVKNDVTGQMEMVQDGPSRTYRRGMPVGVRT